MSFDVDKADALEWSKKEKFPWPHVLHSNIDESLSFMKYRNEYVPQYLLVNSKGEKIIEGLGKITMYLVENDLIEL